MSGPAPRTPRRLTEPRVRPHYFLILVLRRARGCINPTQRPTTDYIKSHAHDESTLCSHATGPLFNHAAAMPFVCLRYKDCCERHDIVPALGGQPQTMHFRPGNKPTPSLVLRLLSTTQQTSSPRRDETCLLTLGSVPRDCRGLADMLVVTTTVGLHKL